MKIRLVTLAIILTAITSVVHAKRVDPYKGSRIFWDTSSQTTIFPTGNYARLIELQDGRLLAAAESGGIAISFSENKGKTWSAPTKIVSPSSKMFLAVPDLIQLSDGTILVGYNPRPEAPYSEERRFGIRVVRSTDNGATWSEPIFIFDAKHNFDDGCWEPSFLELPSGEIQCYFANENEYTSSNEQCISMCRSFDKGLTWSEPVKISFRANSRDGMPVPVLLKDKSEIVVIIEDNGWPGRGNFAATTVRTTLEDNWTSGYVDAGSSNRNMIFETTPAVGIISAAPYLRVLPSGETIASYQGNENRNVTDLQYFDMFVEVGDEHARNFKARSTPFALGADKHSIWNSVAVIDTGIVVAVGSIGEPNKNNSVQIIKGYPKKCFEAKFGTPVIDGAASGDTWTYKNAQQIFMGNVTKNKTTADFLYDSKYLYFTARVIDRDIYTDKVDNDGIFLSLDLENACDTYPQKGMFQFFLDVNGSVTMKYGENNKWNDTDNTEGIKYSVNIKSIYYEMEVAIPWELLGYETAPVQNQMRVNLEIRNRKESAIEKEVIPETQSKQSWSWMEFRLIDNATGISPVTTDNNKIKTIIQNKVLNIYGNNDMTTVSLYSFNGMILHQARNCGSVYRIPLPYSGGGILKIQLEDGSVVNKKILFH
ncbi:putative uncharacterized protein [Tannerella sp. CAG:118]|nr:putative uncharacterized protein [Tannerella sp. CAG:118]